jgi:hypothetical protein
MFTALATILGALTSSIPSIVRIFEKKQELAHEKSMAELKLEAAKSNADIELRLSATKASFAEGESLRTHDSSLDGGKFINSLRASVRPVITYVFFFMFVIIKTSAAYVMLTNGASVPEMLKAVWDPETTAIFGSIVGFWFGSRTFEKYMR